MPTPPIHGQSPSGEQSQMVEDMAKHWRGVGADAPLQELARVEDAAKQLVALNSALATLYFAVFSLGDLNNRVTPGLVWLCLAPVACWLVSLFFATLVFVPRARSGADLDDVRVSAWQDLRKTYMDTVERKLRCLHRSHWSLLGSFIAILVVLGALLFFPAPTESSRPQIVIVLTPTPAPSPTAHHR